MPINEIVVHTYMYYHTSIFLTSNINECYYKMRYAIKQMRLLSRKQGPTNMSQQNKKLIDS